MKILSLPLAIAPLFTPGGSLLLGWMLTFALIAGVVLFVIWLTTRFAGPPALPDWAKIIIWIIVAVALLLFIFAALGIKIP